MSRGMVGDEILLSRMYVCLVRSSTSGAFGKDCLRQVFCWFPGLTQITDEIHLKPTEALF